MEPKSSRTLASMVVWRRCARRPRLARWLPRLSQDEVTVTMTVTLLESLAAQLASPP